MLVKTKAIVLHSFRYGETKAIVDLLTATHGRIACIATLSKSPKAKLKKQYFQPLFIIEPSSTCASAHACNRSRRRAWPSPSRQYPSARPNWQ